jgi:hypothetical protein
MKAGRKKVGKLLISHRYNRLPLLPSRSGGVHRSWSYKTYPEQKYYIISFTTTNRKIIFINLPGNKHFLYFNKKEFLCHLVLRMHLIMAVLQE